MCAVQDPFECQDAWSGQAFGFDHAIKLSSVFRNRTALWARIWWTPFICIFCTWEWTSVSFCNGLSLRFQAILEERNPCTWLPLFARSSRKCKSLSKRVFFSSEGQLFCDFWKILLGDLQWDFKAFWKNEIPAHELSLLLCLPRGVKAFQEEFFDVKVRMVSLSKYV